MTFPKDLADHHKENLTQKCIYLVNQFKAKNTAMWEKYTERLATLKPEESWDFFHEMLVEYQKLVDMPDLKADAAKAVKAVKEKVASVKKEVKKEVKKVVASVAKKVAKKTAAKKAAKKPAAKKPAKKVAKKSVKKPVKKAAAKKTAKKVVKKGPAKKAAPKKAAKKVVKKKR